MLGTMIETAQSCSLSCTILRRLPGKSMMMSGAGLVSRSRTTTHTSQCTRWHMLCTEALFGVVGGLLLGSQRDLLSTMASSTQQDTIARRPSSH